MVLFKLEAEETRCNPQYLFGYWGFFMFKSHGGNLAEVREEQGWLLTEISDFSVNVNPLGAHSGPI